MALYNPYRNYDKGMDDAYMGNEPQSTDSRQYMQGYEYANYLLEDEYQEQSNDHPAPITQPQKIKNNE